MDITQKALLEYVNAAADLAECVKQNVRKGGKITNETVIALNNFIIASNEIKYLTIALEKNNLKLQ